MRNTLTLRATLTLAVVLACVAPALGQFGPLPIYVGIPTGPFNFAAAAQMQDEWCWAASTQMILNWYQIPVTQPQIVQRVTGGTPNWPGSDQMISAALNGWGYTINGNVVSIRSAEFPGPPPPMILIAQLSQQHPILLTFMSGPFSGHAVVITAASYINTPNGVLITSIVVRDPWPDQQNVANMGRKEIAGMQLAQFAPLIRSYWLVTVQ